MVIFGHEEIMVSAASRNPEMARGFMLEKSLYRVHLQPDKGFFFSLDA